MVSPCYCVVCAVRLQFKIFWQGYIKKIRKIYGSPTGIPTDYNPSVFYRELQNNLWDCATFTDGFSDGQYRRNHRRIVAHPEAHACMTRVRLGEYRRPITTESPTDCRTSRSARMSDTCSSARIPTALPTSNTDGITDGICMSDTCPSARIPMDFPTDRKVLRDFWTFLVRISINCRRNYRQNLIPPTTINFRR